MLTPMLTPTLTTAALTTTPTPTSTPLPLPAPAPSPPPPPPPPPLLPVSEYVRTLIPLIQQRTEPDCILSSQALLHLPAQLANKHFFCGPRTRPHIVALLTALCALGALDAHGLAVPSLGVLIAYQRIFDARKHHDMLVDAFVAGLAGPPRTARFCLNALSICAFELPGSISKSLAHILERLSRLVTNALVAVHILDFVCLVGARPALYANFREEEFRLVFGVALAYIQHHNSPDTQGRGGALSQHVRGVAYYIIYAWFLAVALPDRPRHVAFLTRRLLLACGERGVVDEPMEVCFDWLARYTYATADPKPAWSLLGDVVMNPERRVDDGDGHGDPAPRVKTWIWGNSLVTVRTLPRRGWIEVESVRPSGETKFLCKVENVPQVGPGDVDPDRFTDAAVMMEGRDPREMARDVPDPEEEQARDAMNEACMEEARGVFLSRAEAEAVEDRPDSVTGYVWAGSAPSQRRKEITLDPSFFALQLSQYPHLPGPTTRSRLVPATPQLDGLLRTLKRTPVIDTHKIAILYVAPGQTTEREILGNRHGSPAYTRFLEGMGRLIRVRDQRDVYTGDMDPETDGEYAYAWWDDIVQVVFHTATLMPNLPEDPAFTFKKRHVGNDKVRIVWNDAGVPYAQHAIPSAFNLVNLVIQPHSAGTLAAFSDDQHEREFFMVTMQCMDGMPEFGPIGDYKLVSAENLALLLRQVSLLADFLAEVYIATDQDTSTHEYVTNWRRRLQYINKFRERQESEPPPEHADDEGSSLREVRDFTRFF
ncbi:hypothetical protein K439DRAFT_1411148 [Ramaria rubella]|nr:hypothetical protein K439DRAFT_1411148 [Ramaria rubella]